MPPISDPEMVRMPLEQVCLQVRALGHGIAEFLAQALTPPGPESVERAMQSLTLLGALRYGPGQELTALGRLLARLPADVRVGKFLIYGAGLFGLPEPVLTLASAMACGKSPFARPAPGTNSPPSARRWARGQSDWLSVLAAYEAWRTHLQAAPRRGREATSYAFCDEHGLVHSVLMTIHEGRRQFSDALADLGFGSGGNARSVGLEGGAPPTW